MRGFLLVAMTVVFSCSPKNTLPDDVIEPGKMQDVFWDYIRADIYTTDFIKRDTSKNALLENIKLQKAIFRQHNITKEQFYKSYTYYVSKPELMKAIIDSMVAHHSRDQLKQPRKVIMD
jgi:hypothetical protein